MSGDKKKLKKIEIIKLKISHESCVFIIGQCYSIAVLKLEESPDVSADECDSWYEEEKNINYEYCEKDLAKWYACPRQMGTRLVAGQLRTDSFWAEREVNFGLNGWKYDICCNPYDFKTRKALDAIDYCSAVVCSYNQGADFCIRSPRHRCPALIGGNLRMALLQQFSPYPQKN